MHAFAGGGSAGGGRYEFCGADGFGEVGAAGGVVVDGVEEAGEAVRADVEEGAGGVVAVDEVDEGVGGTEGEGLVGAGGFDEAGAAGSIDAAEADRGAAGIGGDFFRGDQDVAGRSAADGRGFVDFAGVVLRINGRAAGEDGELRGEDFDQIAQGVAVNNPVGVGVASLFTAQAVDEDVRMLTTGELGAEFFRIGRIGGEDAVRFAGEAAGGFFRGNEGGDVPSGLGKKIRASFTGVTATGEEDARSWNGFAQDRLKRNFILARLALVLALRRDFWVGVSKARRRRTSSMIPSESNFAFNRLMARSIDSPLRTMTSGISDSHPF